MTNVRLNLEIATEQAKAALGQLSGAIETAKAASDGLSQSQETLQEVLSQTGAGAATDSMTRIVEVVNQATQASEALSQSQEELQRELKQTGSTSGAESMANYVEGLDKAERAAEDLVQSQDQLQKELVQTGSSTERPGEALGRLVDLTDETKKASDGLAKSQDNLQGELKETGSSAAASAEEMGQAATRLLALIGAARTVVDTVKVYASFERTLAVVGSVANASAVDLDRLKKAAREAGASTEFSATEAAEGLLQLSRAGFSVDESIAALLPSLNLATADTLELAEAAGITSAAIKQFNLDAQDSVRVADILIGTANSTDSGVRDIGEAFSYVGPVASALNVSLEETAAIIGVLGDNAIKGSRAGTSFARFLSGLNVTTEPARAALEELGLTQEDLSLKSNSLAEVLDNLRLANIDAYTAEAIFGDVARVAALKLSENVERVRELTAANLDSAGSADTVAKAISNNLIGAYRELTGAIEEVQISIGESSGGTLRLLVDTGTEAIRVLGGLETAETEASAEGNVLAVVLATLAGPTAMSALIAAGSGAYKALSWLGAFTVPGRIALGVAGVASALYGLIAASQEVVPEVDALEQKLLDFRQTLDGFKDTKNVIEGLLRSIDMDVLEGDVESASKSIARLQRIIQGVEDRAGSAGTPLFDADQFKGISKEIDSAIASIEAGAEDRLSQSLAEGLKLGAKQGVDAAAAEIAALDKVFEFSTVIDRNSVFGLLEKASEFAEKADSAKGLLAPFEAIGQANPELEALLKVYETGAQDKAELAVRSFIKFAQLSLLNPEDIANALLTGVADAKAKLDAVPETPRKSPEEEDGLGNTGGIGREKSDALADFIRQQDILSQSVGRSNDELEVLRAQAEAFQNVKALGLPAAVAFANVIGLEVSQRQSLAKALEEEARLNKIGTEERARMVDEVIAYEQALKDARAAEREAAFDTLSQLNSAVAFDLKTLGLSSDQRRRVYEDEIALQAALKIGAEEGAAAYAEYVRFADSAEFATRGQRAADFLSDSFTAFSVQATQDFDNVGDAFEQLLTRLEAQVLNATFGGLFQSLFQNLVGTTLGASLGSAFGFGSPTPGLPGPPGGIGPVYGLGEGGKGLGAGAGDGLSLGTKGYGGAGGYDGFGKGLDVSVTLGDKFDQMVAALQAIATKVSTPAAPSYVPQAGRGYEPSGMGLSDRQLADQARRRFGR